MSGDAPGPRPRVVAVVSARMASSRYPGKATAPLAGRPLLAVLLERIASARGLDGVVLATSNNRENDVLARMAAGATRRTSCAATWSARTRSRPRTSCASPATTR
jgi:CMP-2-keto-3-deoxyoctulosonic acid synthetase